MYRRRTLGFSLAALTLAIGACSGPTAPAGNHPAPATFAPTATTPSSSATAAPTLSSDGYIIRKVGDRAEVRTPDSPNPVFDFWITKIQVDPECYQDRVEGVHMLLLDVTVKTYTPAAPVDLETVYALLNPWAFEIKGADGATQVSQKGECPKSEPLPQHYAANSKYTGQIPLISLAASGTLILLPDGPKVFAPTDPALAPPKTPAPGTSNGWEWRF